MLTCAPRCAVEEVEVRVDRLPAAREADREPPRHRVEEERAVALGAVGAPNRLAGPRRHEDLRLDARDRDVRAHRRLRRQHAAARQRHIRGEAHALLHGAQLVDDAVEVDVLAVRQRRADVHHVVELQVALTDRRRSRRRAESRRPASVPSTSPSGRLRIQCRSPGLPSRTSGAVARRATRPRGVRARRAARWRPPRASRRAVPPRRASAGTARQRGRSGSAPSRSGG